MNAAARFFEQQNIRPLFSAALVERDRQVGIDVNIREHRAERMKRELLFLIARFGGRDCLDRLAAVARDNRRDEPNLSVPV